jgi:hypothetical protein
MAVGLGLLMGKEEEAVKAVKAVEVVVAAVAAVAAVEAVVEVEVVAPPLRPHPPPSPPVVGSSVGEAWALTTTAMRTFHLGMLARCGVAGVARPGVGERPS